MRLLMTFLQRYFCNPSVNWLLFFSFYMLCSEFVPFLIIAIRINKRMQTKRMKQIIKLQMKSELLDRSSLENLQDNSVMLSQDSVVDINMRKEH
jgi:hypothetical protein